MKKRTWLYAAIIVTIAVIIGIFLSRAKVFESKPTTSSTEERSFAGQKRVKIPNPPVIGRSQDNLHVAWAQFTEDGNRWFVVLDGKVFPEDGYDFVGNFVFSPDSKKFAYVVGKGNQQCIVVDSKAGQMYNVTGEPVFSPDGKHLAYEAIDSNNLQCIVLDGKEGGKYYGVNNPVFSLDGKHIAYSIMKEDKERLVVVDGKEGPIYKMQPFIHPVIFGPNGSRVAYAAMKSDKWVVVVNSKEGKEYDGIGGQGYSIALSPDGESFAYVANIEGKWFVVENGEEQPKYDDIAADRRMTVSIRQSLQIMESNILQNGIVTGGFCASDNLILIAILIRKLIKL
ncbi:MAG: hypothetical protein P8Z50_02150 [candidate division WOR-3 bacterium]